MNTRASRCAIWRLHAPPSRYERIQPQAKERTAKLTPNRATFLNGPNSGRSPIPTRKSKRAARERDGIAYHAHGHRKLRRRHLRGESAARRGVLLHAAIGQSERLTDGPSDQGCGTGLGDVSVFA